MENNENLENLNNQNLREKNKAIFDEMANAIKDYDPKEEQRLKSIRDGIIGIIIFYPVAIFCLINYFDYPKELNLNEAKTHIGKVVDIEIPMPKFGRVPYHNSNSCIIYFENLDETKEKLVASNCTYEIIPKIWKAKEIKIYKTKIFGWSNIYQILNSENIVLYQITQLEFKEAWSGKWYFLFGFISMFLFGLYSTYDLIKSKKGDKKC